MQRNGEPACLLHLPFTLCWQASHRGRLPGVPCSTKGKLAAGAVLQQHHVEANLATEMGLKQAALPSRLAA